jgi:hypothetical protein
VQWNLVTMWEMGVRAKHGLGTKMHYLIVWSWKHIHSQALLGMCKRHVKDGAGNLLFFFDTLIEKLPQRTMKINTIFFIKKMATKCLPNYGVSHGFGVYIYLIWITHGIWTFFQPTISLNKFKNTLQRPLKFCES